jgi:hypothetical protein
MKKLSPRTEVLLLGGARITGSFKGAFGYAWEDFYVKDADEIEKFCIWLDKEIGGAGRSNIRELFLAFKNPKDVALANYAKAVKQQIDRIKAI